MKYFLSLLFSFGFTIVSYGQSLQTLNAAEFDKKFTSTKDKTLIDVRTAREYNEGHISGALSNDVNSDEFEQRIDKLDKSKPVFVYCLSGIRSSTAASILTKHGFQKVYNLDGGLRAWVQAQKPIVH